MTQAMLARAAGIPASVVSDYGRGQRNPTLASIEALSKALGKASWEFLRGPLSGEGLPSEDEARRENIAWFSRLTPTQKAIASEMDRGMVERARRFFRGWEAEHLR